MKSTEQDWRPGGMLACHNYWHWSLYYLENNEIEETLALYDNEVGRRAKGGIPLDIVDAASLLKRLVSNAYHLKTGSRLFFSSLFFT